MHSFLKVVGILARVRTSEKWTAVIFPQLAKGESPAWAGQQNGNDPDVLSSQLLDWYLEESTHSSRYFIGYCVLDNFVKVVQMFRQFHSRYSRGKLDRDMTEKCSSHKTIQVVLAAAVKKSFGGLRCAGCCPNALSDHTRQFSNGPRDFHNRHSIKTLDSGPKTLPE